MVLGANKVGTEWEKKYRKHMIRSEGVNAVYGMVTPNDVTT